MTALTRLSELPTIVVNRFRSLPFYIIAVLLHVLFFLIFGTYEVTRVRGEGMVSVFTAPTAADPAAADAPPPPPPPPDRAQQNVKIASMPTASARNASFITTRALGASAVIPSTVTTAPATTRQPSKTAAPEMKLDAAGASGVNMPGLELRKLLGRASRFVQEGTGVTGTGRSTRAKFACYWALYQGGDWNCNPTALTNLTTQVARWSRDRIQQKTAPVPIVVSSKDLFTIKPPFIFITGHKDFTFTEEEVENLRQYLHAGGAIWADNDLPGRRSRFDMAFRREMKRVLTDKDFEKLPDNHPIMFAYYPLLRKLPSGMNNYEEPIEVIRLIANEIAVVYTLNAYGDLWECALDENDRIDRYLYRTGPRQAYHKWGPHYGSYYTATHYRNVNDETVVAAYKLGINIVVHLLNRYDDRLRAMGVQRP
jgi:hypothetical protein